MRQRVLPCKTVEIRTKNKGSIFLECKLSSKSLLQKKLSLTHRQCTHMPFKVSIHKQRAPCSRPQHYIWAVHHPTTQSALTTCSGRLWSRFGQVTEEPDTAYGSRPEVNADASDTWGEIGTRFPFVSSHTWRCSMTSRHAVVYCPIWCC